jgi:hypothetical protein
MIQANPSYRFTSERARRMSHMHGPDSVSLLALKRWLHLATPPTQTRVVALVSHKRLGRRVPSTARPTEEVER